MQTAIRRAIIVCALGYFIDVFDIQLFGVLRVPSLTELGVSADRLPVIGGYILNAQMVGMVTGAFLWGWLGDRFGRLKALYGSILIYSLGTLACSLVHDPITYGILRFIAGFGLAGETGAAITLIAELMPAQKRGWGITIAAGFGLLGPVIAIVISLFMPWRATYLIAGLLGLLLFAIRMRLTEPTLFQKMKIQENTRGSLRLILQPRQFLFFICCVLIGLPLNHAWFILNFFSLEFSHAVLQPNESFDQKLCLLLFYVGTSLGDFLSGTLSQLWQSRRKAFGIFLAAAAAINAVYLMIVPDMKITAPALYGIYFALGIAVGCWVLFSMIAAEHFGTNIRATTSIVVTNCVRGLVIFMVFAFQEFRQAVSITDAAALIALALYPLAFLALFHLRETCNLDLDYIEKPG